MAKAIRPDLPMIILSDCNADEKSIGKASAADRQVKKPFNIDDLDQAIRELIGERRQRQTLPT